MNKQKLPRGLRNNTPGNIRKIENVNWLGDVDATNKTNFTF